MLRWIVGGRTEYRESRIIHHMAAQRFCVRSHFSALLQVQFIAPSERFRTPCAKQPTESAHAKALARVCASQRCSLTGVRNLYYVYMY